MTQNEWQSDRGAHPQADRAGHEPSLTSQSLPAGDHPLRDRLDRYDAYSTRIVCSGGWVIAMINQLTNGKWTIAVGDRRYTQQTFPSVRAAFKWWKERRAAIADRSPEGGDAQQAPREAQGRGPSGIAGPYLPPPPESKP